MIGPTALEPWRPSFGAQLVGEGNGGFVFLLIVGILHVLIFIIDIVAGDGVVGLAESKEDGDDPINLFLAKAMAYGTRHGAHGSDKTARIGNLEIGIGGRLLLAGRSGLALSALANSLRKLNLGQETLHKTDQQGIGNDERL